MCLEWKEKEALSRLARSFALSLLSPLRLPVPPSRRRKEYVKITHRLVYASPIGNFMPESRTVPSYVRPM